MEDFQTIPAIFKDEVFTQAFEKAELARFNPTDLEAYEMNLKIYRDYKNTIDTAYDEGKIEVAKSARQMGLSIADIIKLTGLTESDINKL